MTLTLDSAAPVAATPAKLATVDCDLHPTPRSPNDLLPFLSQRWQAHMRDYGPHIRQGITGQEIHPRMDGRGMRLDAFPETGPAGSDLGLMQRQHLDANDIGAGTLIALGTAVSDERNQEYGAALSRAVNQWQLAAWVEPDPRLHAGIIVTQEDPAAAVAEIDYWAADKRFSHIMLSPKPIEPLGRRRYWPIYEAACRAGLPVVFHPVIPGGGHPSSGIGWPTFYIQDHYTSGPLYQNIAMSLVFEGVFEKFPDLKVVFVEGGFTWVPHMTWRFDRQWERMRSEVPHVKKKPSEYLRQNTWFTTQPMEECRTPGQLREIIEWIGFDRILYSSDYPHWDYDDPKYAFKLRLSDEERQMIFSSNARRAYRL